MIQPRKSQVQVQANVDETDVASGVVGPEGRTSPVEDLRRRRNLASLRHTSVASQHACDATGVEGGRWVSVVRDSGGRGGPDLRAAWRTTLGPCEREQGAKISGTVRGLERRDVRPAKLAGRRE